MHAQDHYNPFGGNALSPTQGRRLAVGDRQKVSWLDGARYLGALRREGGLRVID